MDPRDAAAEYGHDYDKFDEDKMVLIYTIPLDDEDPRIEEMDEEEVSFPAKFQVCSLCDGKGKHVNPSIDAHGISAEEFYDDPDFAEEYMSGTYDVPCYTCKGKRVEPVIDESGLDESQKAALKRLESMQRDEAEFRREQEAERRMGA
jgi:hypothetical protein